MKVFSATVMTLCMAALTSWSAPIYFFDARDSNDKELRSHYGEASTNACQDMVRRNGTVIKVYRVVVSPAEYTAGWSALTAAKKISAKAAATDERAQVLDKISKENKVIILWVKDELNVLRALHGLPNLTNAQVKTALKVKYQSLP